MACRDALRLLEATTLAEDAELFERLRATQAEHVMEISHVNRAMRVQHELLTQELCACEGATPVLKPTSYLGIRQTVLPSPLAALQELRQWALGQARQPTQQPHGLHARLSRLEAADDAAATRFDLLQAEYKALQRWHRSCNPKCAWLKRHHHEIMKVPVDTLERNKHVRFCEEPYHTHSPIM